MGSPEAHETRIRLWSDLQSRHFQLRLRERAPDTRRGPGGLVVHTNQGLGKWNPENET